MALIKLTYQRRIILLFIVFCWVVIGCFLFFQYSREKEIKAQLLNEQLQNYNLGLIEHLALGEKAEDYIDSQKSPVGELRVSVIDNKGNVIFDNSLDTLPSANHLSRPEIAEALSNGTGYSVRRHSQTTDNSYFYSAMAREGIVVRSAAPYNVTVGEMLGADRGFTWFIIVLVAVMSLLAWLIVYLVNDRDKQIQERVRVKKELTNNINHELKTPLAAIQICIETLKRRPDLTGIQREEIIDKCLSNSARLNALMTDVATLTRLDDGQSNIVKEHLNLRRIVTDVVAEFPTSLPVKGRISPDIWINGNHNLLSAVFRNLIQNANAYSQGTEISINALQTEGRIIITFADNGVGIPAEHLDRIFERFYRIDKGRSREKGGTGLGLAIVRNAVQFHEGTITASNRPEGGLLFTIKI